MESQEMLQSLNIAYSKFSLFLEHLNEEDFLYTNGNSWSAGQQLDHIVKSVAPLNTYMKLPDFSKTLMFGKNKSVSKSPDEIKESYLALINAGAKAPSNYVPEVINYAQKELLISKLNYLIKKLISSLEKLNEKKLDTFRAPHPLLGKLSIREMIYFTIYHVEHHNVSIKKMLKK